MRTSEDKIQQECYLHFKNKYCLKHHKPRYYIFSVPNGGKSAIEQMYKKSLGMSAGVSDMIIVMPNKVIFVEFKTDKGKQSDEQKEFQKIVEDLGHEYILVRSLEEFINNIDKI